MDEGSLLSLIKKNLKRVIYALWGF